jgi:DNA gyrase subunit A
MGRTAAGVRGIKLQEDQKMVGLIVVEEGDILSVTENGYGKRTEADEYPTYGRGGQGVVSIKTSDRNGDVVGAVQVTEDNEIMLISDGGVLVRTPVGDISVMSRNTQGVRLIRLAEDEKLVELERIANLGGEDEELEEGDVDQEENSDAPEQVSDESENDSEA